MFRLKKEVFSYFLLCFGLFPLSCPKSISIDFALAPSSITAPDEKFAGFFFQGFDFMDVEDPNLANSSYLALDGETKKNLVGVVFSTGFQTLQEDRSSKALEKLPMGQFRVLLGKDGSLIFYLRSIKLSPEEGSLKDPQPAATLIYRFAVSPENVIINKRVFQGGIVPQEIRVQEGLDAVFDELLQKRREEHRKDLDPFDLGIDLGEEYLPQELVERISRGEEVEIEIEGGGVMKFKLGLSPDITPDSAEAGRLQGSTFVPEESKDYEITGETIIGFVCDHSALPGEEIVTLVLSPENEDLLGLLQEILQELEEFGRFHSPEAKPQRLSDPLEVLAEVSTSTQLLPYNRFLFKEGEIQLESDTIFVRDRLAGKGHYKLIFLTPEEDSTRDRFLSLKKRSSLTTGVLVYSPALLELNVRGESESHYLKFKLKGDFSQSLPLEYPVGEIVSQARVGEEMEVVIRLGEQREVSLNFDQYKGGDYAHYAEMPSEMLAELTEAFGDKINILERDDLPPPPFYLYDFQLGNEAAFKQYQRELEMRQRPTIQYSI